MEPQNTLQSTTEQSWMRYVGAELGFRVLGAAVVGAEGTTVRVDAVDGTTAGPVVRAGITAEKKQRIGEV